MSAVDVRLRVLEDADLDQAFEWERDPSAVAMAACTGPTPPIGLRSIGTTSVYAGDADATLLAIEVDGALAGTIGSFTRNADRAHLPRHLVTRAPR